ncbi:restriction endonuclease subunit S [Streptosporangium sp. NBC_01810]|uniref:restriction endonuclease subunit S n=1 Tax=Streptosporangium sp. NBC_01810 TaxID=2975951 RepID=UPI002DDAADAE|nr:restriction endonuclease subunit S [Streptosporangium sp. NBC_01810]WSA25404.1 restriction endonuclease subunit S [Streptosporangium sp. NBC_01810]
MGINQPSSWTATTLGASADFINGYPFAHTDRGETGLPIIRIEQLKNRAAHCDRYSGRLPEQYKITDGDIVFSWSGSFFVDLWERGPAWLNQHLFKVIPVSHLDQTFFMHLLRWSIGELQQRSHGSTMSHITRKDINSFGLTLPPLSDQRRITEILDTLDAQIASQREVINKLKIIAAAIMDSHLTKIIRTADAEFSLATLADIASGVTLGTETGGSIELPYLRVANVQDGYIDTSEMKRVHVSRTDAKRYLLEAGDVLLTEGGDLDKLGRGAVWDARIDPCICQNHIFRVRCDRIRLLPEYLAAYCSSHHGKSYFLSIAKQTTNLASINSTQLKSMPIPLPSIGNQRELIEMADAGRNQLSKESSHLQRLELLKQGLMEDLLTGRVRVSAAEAVLESL